MLPQGSQFDSLIICTLLNPHRRVHMSRMRHTLDAVTQCSQRFSSGTVVVQEMRSYILRPRREQPLHTDASARGRTFGFSHFGHTITCRIDVHTWCCTHTHTHTGTRAYIYAYPSATLTRWHAACNRPSDRPTDHLSSGAAFCAKPSVCSRMCVCVCVVDQQLSTCMPAMEPFVLNRRGCFNQYAQIVSNKICILVIQNL